ncbi:hypothetical protein DRE_05056 [Drechslerella stenobrocha 248]|uniref:Peptidase A1 domain-containing protein n=1 Tax=Drechslerella stenobrocha 248 TaxID=1043628 RepID=W7HRB7_9PEZI|nr:hypothetical protein DRE_05056 [Drechslerella stenobrocha 248]
MRLLASALCLAACLVPIKAFVPWRPDVSDLDPATLHAIKPPPPAALRRHNLQISRAAAKFTRRAHASTTSNSRPVARPVAPLARREDKTSGPIGLSSDPNDISYWVNVDFGSSQKSFRLVLDTGSADTWVPSSECIAQSCLAHRTYGPGDSSTLTFTDNKTFSIKYASGNVEGSIVNDSLSLGPVTLENVSFGLATVVSDDFTAFPVDGILGLGFPSASVQKVPTFLDNLISQQIITKRVFGVHLHRSSDAAGNGSVIFGGIDSSRIEGGPTALKYYSLNTTSHLWSIRLSDVLIDGKSAGFEEGRNVVIDTGTALVLIPPDDALKLHQPISGTRSNGQTFYIPCNTNVRLKLRFGSDEYEISPKDYVGDVVDAGNNLCLSLIVGRSVNRIWEGCTGSLFNQNEYDDFSPPPNCLNSIRSPHNNQDHHPQWLVAFFSAF